MKNCTQNHKLNSTDKFFKHIQVNSVVTCEYYEQKFLGVIPLTEIYIWLLRKQNYNLKVNN